MCLQLKCHRGLIAHGDKQRWKTRELLLWESLLKWHISNRLIGICILYLFIYLWLFFFHGQQYVLTPHLNFSECPITAQQVERQTISIDCKRTGIRGGALLGINMAENIESIIGPRGWMMMKDILKIIYNQYGGILSSRFALWLHIVLTAIHPSIVIAVDCCSLLGMLHYTTRAE